MTKSRDVRAKIQNSDLQALITVKQWDSKHLPQSQKESPRYSTFIQQTRQVEIEAIEHSTAEWHSKQKGREFDQMRDKDEHRAALAPVAQVTQPQNLEVPVLRAALRPIPLTLSENFPAICSPPSYRVHYQVATALFRAPAVP